MTTPICPAFCGLFAFVFVLIFFWWAFHGLPGPVTPEDDEEEDNNNLAGTLDEFGDY